MAALIKPRPLPEGGTIGVAAASSPFENRSEIDRSIRWYAERGYHVKLADGVYARDDYVAGDSRRRPERAVRRHRGRRDPDAARWLWRVADRLVPRLRRHRREPEGADRLLRRHRPARRDSPTDRACHLLRSGLHRHGQRQER